MIDDDSSKRYLINMIPVSTYRIGRLRPRPQLRPREPLFFLVVILVSVFICDAFQSSYSYTVTPLGYINAYTYPYRQGLDSNCIHMTTKKSVNNNNIENQRIQDSIRIRRRSSSIFTQRRQLLQKIGTTTSILIPCQFLLFNNNKANAAQTTGEAIRRTAANIPGYGQADIYYPSLFLGKWKMTRTLNVLMSDNNDFNVNLAIGNDGNLNENPMLLPMTLSYDVRFITVDGDDGVGIENNSNDKVIADRQFNQESYYNALRQAILNYKEINANKNNLNVRIPPTIQAISWSPSNPNVLTTSYSNQSNQEIKVTKRSTDIDTTNGFVSSSEYRRTTATKISDYNMNNEVPTINASRVLNKWKINNKNSIDGIEVVYIDRFTSMLGDPMSSASSSNKNDKNQSQSVLSSKCLLHLERY
mmetsp:Transcript_28299/g.32967  ORF Transcript_28299/g.32967 Transcript_28299/m.32967 type:complete len:416 (+) Transcript_28299:58-1305(+)